MAVMRPVSRMVRRAPMGSTIPDITPIAKARPLPKPWPSRGMEMTAPSGTFCRAMPAASAKAAAAEMKVSPERAPAKTTPTAMPSGRLWSVTASTSIVDLPRPQLLPSGQSEPRCRCGMMVSSSRRKPTPNMKPAAAGSQPVTFCCSASSMAGMMSDQTEAAIMTPEAKPRSSFWIPGLTSPFRKKTKQEPRAVPRKGMSMPRAVLRVSSMIRPPFNSDYNMKTSLRKSQNFYFEINFSGRCRVIIYAQTTDRG